MGVFDHKTSGLYGQAFLVISGPRVRLSLLAFEQHVRPIFFDKATNKQISANDVKLPFIVDQTARGVASSDQMVLALKKSLTNDQIMTWDELNGLKAKDFR